MLIAAEDASGFEGAGNESFPFHRSATHRCSRERRKRHIAASLECSPVRCEEKSLAQMPSPAGTATPPEAADKEARLSVCSVALGPPPLVPKPPPLCSSHHGVGLLLANLLLVVAVLPSGVTLAVDFFLPNSTELRQPVVPGFYLTRSQLVGVFVFAATDLSLYALVHWVAHGSHAFLHCSQKLRRRVHSGTQFLPAVLLVKMLQPIAVLSSNALEAEAIFVWAVRALCFLFLVSIVVPLLAAEMALLRVVGEEPGPVAVGLLQPMGVFFAPHRMHRERERQERRLPALVFLGGKVALLFFFLMETAVVNLGLPSPLLIDYPLVLCVANLIFVFYSHRGVIVKHNVMETRRTTITSEFVCVDGRLCQNVFRPNRVLSTALTEHSFMLPAAFEFTVCSRAELPHWLLKELGRRRPVGR